MNSADLIENSGTADPFWVSWSIRTRLLLLVFLSVLPAMGIILKAGVEEQAHDIETVQRKVLLTVESLARQQDIAIAGIRQTLVTIAHYPAIREGDLPAIRRLFSQLHQNAPSRCRFLYAHPDGSALIADSRQVSFNLADRKYFQKVLAERDFVVGEYVASRISNEAALPFAYPVMNEQEQISGIVIAVVDLENYRELLPEEGFPKGSVIGIEDRFGQRLFRYPALPETVAAGIGQPLPLKSWQRISGLTSKGTYTEEGADGIRRIYGFIQLRSMESEQPYLYIRVGIPEKIALLPATNKLRFNLLLFCSACGMALAAAWFLGNLTLVDPIKQLAEVSRQLGSGNLTARSALSHTQRGEIGLLAQSLDIMAYRQELREMERTASLEAIQRLSRRNQLILDAAGEGIVGLNAEGLVIFINPAAATMTGYRSDELLGQDFHARIHHSTPSGGFYPREMCPMFRSLRDGSACRIRDEVLWRKDGTSFPCAYSSTPIIHDGRITGAVIIYRDISERRLAENLLRNREEHFRLLIENVSDIIIVVDHFGTISYVSPSLEKAMGYRPVELEKQNACRLIHQDDLNDVADAFGRSLIAPGAGFSIQLRCLHSDRSWRIVDSIGKSFLDRNNRLRIAITAHDITEKKLAEEEKEKMEAQFLQSQKMESIGRLAGGVAHDFNNMLSVILGHSGLMIRQLSPGDPLHSNLLEIRNAASRSADLTRQLLAFAREQTIIPKVLNLNSAVSDILKMLQRLIGEQITIDWQADANLWPVKIDPTQIDQILMNLVVNARDAIQGIGSITIATNNLYLHENPFNARSGSPPHSYVLLQVSDTGAGMDKATINHIFEPFFTTKQLGKGTGLGLATVYGAVRQNHGFIAVESEPGRGTTFKICLPRSFSEIGENPLAPPMLIHRAGGTILLVEDERSLLDLNQGLLRQHGYQVLAASDPETALEVARNFPDQIQLLITDVIMPKMNGIQLRNALSAVKSGYKCLFLSGYASVAGAFCDILDKDNHFLRKPVAPETLVEKVETMLNSRMAPPQSADRADHSV